MHMTNACIVQGMDEARAALSQESAKVLRLEAEAAESHKKLAQAAEEQRELVSLRRQVSPVLYHVMILHENNQCVTSTYRLGGNQGLLVRC
jgi:hypothetical protein